MSILPIECRNPDGFAKISFWLLMTDVDEQSLWLAFQRACHADHSLHMGRSISIEGDDIQMHSGQECAKGKLS